MKVVQYADLAKLIPRANVVVHHGGSGLFVQSILGGASQIVLPMGADQPWTADRVDALEVGKVLNSQAASSTDIAERAAELLTSEESRERVREIRAETLSLPDPRVAADELEALVGLHA